MNTLKAAIVGLVVTGIIFSLIYLFANGLEGHDTRRIAFFLGGVLSGSLGSMAYFASKDYFEYR